MSVFLFEVEDHNHYYVEDIFDTMYGAMYRAHEYIEEQASRFEKEAARLRRDDVEPDRATRLQEAAQYLRERTNEVTILWNWNVVDRGGMKWYEYSTPETPYLSLRITERTVKSSAAQK